MSSKRWDFKLESSESSGKSGTPDPSLGWRADDASVTATGAIKKPAIDKSFLDKKAWEAVMQPAQGVFMNMFMLWMMGSNPGIFGIMMLAYALTSSVAQLKNVNNVFLPFTQQNVDCSFQKIAYVLICLGVPGPFIVFGYLLYSASGMGLLPTQTGDWISKIPYVPITERLI